jgi:hypothetical protein
MKTLLISYCTEYDFGQRPDGFMIGKTKEPMLKHIEESNKMGSRECFWRYSEPQEVHCENKVYAKIEKKMNAEGLAFFDNKDEEKLNLYKKI